MNILKKMQRPAGVAFAGAAVLSLGVGLAIPAHADDTTTDEVTKAATTVVGVPVAYAGDPWNAPKTDTDWTVVLNGDTANAQHIRTNHPENMVEFHNVPVGKVYTAEVSWNNDSEHNCHGTAVAHPVDSNPAVEGKSYMFQPVYVTYTSASCSAEG